MVNHRRPWSHRLWYWWHYEKPSSQRRLIKYGAICSLLLLALGIYFDLQGKQFYDNNPFLTSIPKDLFKLLVIGTAGVLFLEDLRTSWRALPELRSRAPETGRAAGAVAQAVLSALGIQKESLLLRRGPGGVLSSDTALVLYGTLNDLSNSYRKLVDGSYPQEEVSTDEARTAWKVATIREWQLPPDLGITELKQATDEFAEKLRHIEPFFPPPRRELIGTLQAHVSELPSAVTTVQPKVRHMLSQPVMKRDEMRELAFGLMTISSTIFYLWLFLKNLEEAE